MADALVGRVETIDLWPFTHGEIAGVTDRFVDLIFDEPTQLLRNGELGRGEYIDLAVRGGFPEAVQAPRRAGAIGSRPTRRQSSSGPSWHCPTSIESRRFPASFVSALPGLHKS
jgi:hypothetical protein